MAVNDETIVRMFFERNEQALTEVLGKYGAYVRSIARNILANDEDAEECVNDTWMQAWKSIPPNRPADLKAYLGKIARNLSFNRFQKEHAKKRGGSETVHVLEELEECIGGGSTPEEEILKQELSKEINLFLSRLPKEKRMLFVARYFYADSISEIAKRFGISENVVSVRLNRIRKALKTHLSERGFES